MSRFPHHMKRSRIKRDDPSSGIPAEYNIQGFRGEKFCSEVVIASSYAEATQIAMKRFKQNSEISVRLVKNNA